MNIPNKLFSNPPVPTNAKSLNEKIDTIHQDSSVTEEKKQRVIKNTLIAIQKLKNQLPDYDLNSYNGAVARYYSTDKIKADPTALYNMVLNGIEESKELNVIVIIHVGKLCMLITRETKPSDVLLALMQQGFVTKDNEGYNVKVPDEDLNEDCMDMG